MKTSTKIYAATLVIVPFLPWALFYWYATEIERVNIEYPKDEVIQHVKSTDDIDAIKKLLISELDTKQKTNESESSTYYTNAEMILSLAVFNAVLLFMFYRSLMNKGSNKSSNLTGEEDSPAS